MKRIIFFGSTNRSGSFAVRFIMFILSLVFFGFILLFFAAAAAVGLILLPVFLVFILPWFFRKKNKEEVRDNEDRIVEIIETKAEVVEDDDIKLIEEADKRGE